jgi:2-polyprenyl-6-hydroxyphenyl methylase/3-demethylubiquinone-9 3-methyltransferase
VGRRNQAGESMKKIDFDPAWPESWRTSHPYDRMEIYGARDCAGYAAAYQTRWRQTLALIRKATPPGARILDVAAAQGNFTLRLAAMGYRVTWNDLRAELVEYVKLKWESGDVEFTPGNVFDLGLKGDFDTILIAEVIEHVAHPDDFLARIATFVKPGGHVVLTTPNGGYFLNRLPKFTDCGDPSQYESRQFQPNSDGHIFCCMRMRFLRSRRKRGWLCAKSKYSRTRSLPGISRWSGC